MLLKFSIPSRLHLRRRASKEGQRGQVLNVVVPKVQLLDLGQPLQERQVPNTLAPSLKTLFVDQFNRPEEQFLILRVKDPKLLFIGLRRLDNLNQFSNPVPLCILLLVPAPVGLLLSGTTGGQLPVPLLGQQAQNLEQLSSKVSCPVIAKTLVDKTVILQPSGTLFGRISSLGPSEIRPDYIRKAAKAARPSPFPHETIGEIRLQVAI